MTPLARQRAFQKKTPKSSACSDRTCSACWNANRALVINFSFNWQPSSESVCGKKTGNSTPINPNSTPRKSLSDMPDTTQATETQARESQPSPVTGKYLVQLSDDFFFKFLRMIVALVALFYVVQLLPKLSGVLTTLVAAILITAVLDPIVSLVERSNINRISAIILVYLLIFLGLFVVVRTSWPLISKQFTSLAHYFESMEADPSVSVFDISRLNLGKNIPFLNLPAVQEKITSNIESSLTEFLRILFDGVITVLSSVPYLIIIAFAVFFFLKDGWKIKRALIQSMPNRYFEMSLIILDKTTTQLSRYIRGQLIVSLAVGSLSIIALTLLGVRYSVIIGAVAGIANMIPYFGPIAGAIPAIIMGFMDTGSVAMVMAITGAFAAIQLTENVLISPYVVARSVELHPLLIIIVILIGQALMGIWGMLLAVPVASILKVIISEIRWGILNYRLKDKELL
ncbi:MAG TPA: AI-2E family transporter [Bacteroidetes bacterium]|nr:AI-2E family transporter [Bacteroidota bacterium]